MKWATVTMKECEKCGESWNFDTPGFDICGLGMKIVTVLPGTTPADDVLKAWYPRCIACEHTTDSD